MSIHSAFRCMYKSLWENVGMWHSSTESANAFQIYIASSGEKNSIAFLDSDFIQCYSGVTASPRATEQWFLNEFISFLRKAGSGTCKVASHRESLKLLWRQACHPWPAKLLQALQISGSSSNLKWLSKGQVTSRNSWNIAVMQSKALELPSLKGTWQFIAACCGVQVFSPHSTTKSLNIPDLSRFLPVDVIVLSSGNVFLSLVEPQKDQSCAIPKCICVHLRPGRWTKDRLGSKMNSIYIYNSMNTSM